MKAIQKAMLKAIASYAMLTPNARVLVAVSGGKDSSTLLWYLHELAGWDIFKATLIPAVTAPLYPDPHWDDRLAFLEALCARLGLPLTVLTTDMETAPHALAAAAHHTDINTAPHALAATAHHTDINTAPHALAATAHHTDINTAPHALAAAAHHTDINTAPHALAATACKTLVLGTRVHQYQTDMSCYTCSQLRRKALFTEAVRHGCNTIALGHHLDDILTTALMNMLRHGTREGMEPVRVYNDGVLRLIRPLIFVPEETIIRFCRAIGWRTFTCTCTCGTQGTRHTYRSKLEQLTDGSIKQKRNMLNVLHSYNLIDEFTKE